MEFFKIRKDIPFMRYALTFNVISFFTFLVAVVLLVWKGLNFSIEFTGGLVLEARYEQAAELDKIRTTMEGFGVKEPQVQSFGTPRDVMIRLPILKGQATAQQSDAVMAALRVDEPKVELRRVEFVGPQVGAELLQDGSLALLVVVIGIMIYLALRFEWKFAVAAIVANMHDVVIILGFFAAFQWEFSLAVLAAVLAVLGYSVNESVIIADRIRENFKKMRKAEVDHVIDNAITSTISRTVITHGLTQMMVLTMLLFGGPTLHYFALALTIGICFGIYSSVLVMAPITKWLGIKREDLIKPIKKETEVLEP